MLEGQARALSTREII